MITTLLKPGNKLASMLAAGSLAFGLSAFSSAAERVGDFALLDHEGYFHQLSYYDNQKAVAFLVQSSEDKAVAKAAASFKDLQAEYADRGVQFFMINPTGKQDRAAVKKAAAKYGTDIPVLMDDSQLVSEAMNIDKTAEAILVDPTSLTVIYRGPADKHLAAALDQVLAGKAVEVAKLDSKGKAVTYPAKQKHQKAAPSYSKDVAPILADNCARCHRDGGIAPFAMDSHTMIKGWAPMIREVVLTKRMPPAQIDPHVGKFKESYTLTPSETQTLVHWIEAGANKDGDSDPLAALTWPATEWGFGEPDLIINVPRQEIPATGVLDYISVVVPIEGLDRDRWVKASQYMAGDRTVLHHTLNALIPPGTKVTRGSFVGGGDPNAARITAYIPGAQPQHEPANTGGLLQKGSSLALQLHYTTTGKAAVDESQIGLWFYDDDEIPTERMTGECACIFTPTWKAIPPFDPDYEMEQTINIAKDAYIYSMLPHMHFRGKRMRFYADYPDGSSEELLNIAQYNYNWQLHYELEEPIRVPAGTKIRAVGAFDNSEQNPANPDPSREVPWGQQSWDEMFFGAVTYKYVDQSENAVATK